MSTEVPKDSVQKRPWEGALDPVGVILNGTTESLLHAKSQRFLYLPDITQTTLWPALSEQRGIWLREEGEFRIVVVELEGDGNGIPKGWHSGLTQEAVPRSKNEIEAILGGMMYGVRSTSHEELDQSVSSHREVAKTPQRAEDPDPFVQLICEF
jgi:hypothetical protein